MISDSGQCLEAAVSALALRSSWQESTRNGGGPPLLFCRQEAPDTHSTPLCSWGLPVGRRNSLGGPAPHSSAEACPPENSLPRAPLLPGSDQVWNGWDLHLGGSRRGEGLSSPRLT